MRKCPFCGADIEESARFCLYCMQSLTEKEQILPHKKKKPQWLLILAVIVAAFFVSAIVGLCVWSALKSDNSVDESSFDSAPILSQSETSDAPSIDETSHIHSYSLEKTDAEYQKETATCLSPATYYYSCECGEKGTETFSYGELSGHTVVTDLGYPSDCVKFGLTDGSHCSVCNIVFLSQTKIPVVNHTFDDEMDAVCNICEFVRVLNCNHAEAIKLSSVSATCTAGGLTEGKKCVLCEEILVPQTAIAPLGHKEETIQAISPTCTDAGKTEGLRCSRCQVVLVYQQHVPAKGHDFDTENPLSPCSDCGAEQPHAHSYSLQNTADEYLNEAATCLSPALYYYSCVCGKAGTESFSYGKKGAHVEVIDEGYEAGCTTEGLTEGAHCAVCKDALVPQYRIFPPGHTYNPSDKLEPCLACGEAGQIIVTVSEIPTVIVKDKYVFRVNSCTYAVKEGDEESWLIDVYINYTNLSSVDTPLGPGISISVYVDGERVTGYGGSGTLSCSLAPNESGTCIRTCRVTNIGDSYHIEIHE